MTNSRRKGVRGELEWRDYLRTFGIEARRGRQYSGNPDAPDVVSDLDPFFHAEVKRVEKLNVEVAMCQAGKDCGETQVPYVAHRRNRTTWIVSMRAVDVVPMMLAAVAGGWRPRDE